ncbi:uncharacterized protein BKA55DRAFT_569475 [Fusarium redolens]|uniref:F-box domain-containing protein n=1 Tax=Fusarium redolens TaxID=48865 RepID=A0A9P9K442_FUSRE|nr:uncharacterized protein BKA55DRAFT_569475 [Fusarium redolens]KAH7248577.1 hypothetical protein BKA55DRAFT_569475 [Fusarium redolens]
MSILQHSSAASLETLPPDILLPIVTYLPGLDILWDLMRASPQVWRLFNDHAVTIVDAILSGPNAILISEIANAVRAVILVRSNDHPFRNLYDLQIRFLRSLFPQSTWGDSGSNPDPIIIDREMLSVAEPCVVVVRSVVATAAHITALAQAFLTSCLERVRDPSFRPLHLVNPEDRYTSLYRPDPDGKRIRAWDQVFKGEPAKVTDAGQPTWVEEMRAVRALWVTQLVGEIKSQKENLGWPTEDIEKLGRMEAADFADAVGGNPAMASEEVRSVMDYLKTLGDLIQDTYYQLPRPPRFARWTTAPPNLSPQFAKVTHHRKDGSTFTRVEKTEDYSWGRTKDSLGYDAPGMSIFKALNKPRHHPTGGASPIEGVKFNSFRPLGFAFWDVWRMYLLGMHSPVGKHWLGNDTFYFFAWESVLPFDEVVNIKAGLRLGWKKELEERQEAQRRSKELSNS